MPILQVKSTRLHPLLLEKNETMSTSFSKLHQQTSDKDVMTLDSDPEFTKSRKWWISFIIGTMSSNKPFKILC
jgi:hypothetical protein